MVLETMKCGEQHCCQRVFSGPRSVTVLKQGRSVTAREGSTAVIQAVVGDCTDDASRSSEQQRPLNVDTSGTCYLTCNQPHLELTGRTVHTRKMFSSPAGFQFSSMKTSFLFWEALVCVEGILSSLSDLHMKRQA